MIPDVMSSGSSDGGRSFIHLVSVDGPNPNAKPKKRTEAPKPESDQVTDFSK